MASTRGLSNEHVALVTFGHETKIQHHFTNKFNEIRRVVSEYWYICVVIIFMLFKYLHDKYFCWDHMNLPTMILYQYVLISNGLVVFVNIENRKFVLSKFLIWFLFYLTQYACRPYHDKIDSVLPWLYTMIILSYMTWNNFNKTKLNGRDPKNAEMFITSKDFTRGTVY